MLRSLKWGASFWLTIDLNNGDDDYLCVSRNKLSEIWSFDITCCAIQEQKTIRGSLPMDHKT